MREIKFRGKSTMSLEKLEDMHFTDHENGWFYGNLIMYLETPYIVGDFIEADQEYVIPEFWTPVHADSVSQYTGLKDKNGTEIYEKDALKVMHRTSRRKYTGHVIHERDLILRVMRFKNYRHYRPTEDLASHDFDWGRVTHFFPDIEVIGNIYENPELLEVD